MEFNKGKVGINLGGWYGIYLGGKGSLFVYNNNQISNRQVAHDVPTRSTPHRRRPTEHLWPICFSLTPIPGLWNMDTFSATCRVAAARQCSRIRIFLFFQISKNMTFYVFLK